MCTYEAKSRYGTFANSVSSNSAHTSYIFCSPCMSSLLSVARFALFAIWSFCALTS